MAFVAKLLYLIGTSLLVHSSYSAYEFNLYLKFMKHANVDLELPLDIKLEVLCGVVVCVIGSFISIVHKNTYTLVDNKKVDNTVAKHDSIFFKPINMEKATIELEKMGAGPFQIIENKPAFLDITQKRKEFSDWSEKHLQQ